MKQPNFYITPEVYQMLVQNDGWKINEVPLESGKLIRKFFGKQETFALFSSGLAPDAIAQSGEPVAGIDWIRIETNPKPNEQPLNIYRYMIGGKVDLGYPVFYCGHSGTPGYGWATLDDLTAYLEK